MAVYTAKLMLQDNILATITLAADTDADAKTQLDVAKPTAFEGIANTSWKIEKHLEPIEVTL
jgi:hypothetical protein